MQLDLFDTLGSASKRKNTKSRFIHEIINADCMKVIKGLPDRCIDLIATDPPYEIEFEKNKWDTFGILDWETLSKEFNRILKPTGNLVIFQGWSNVCKTIEFLNKFFILKNWIIYDRIKGRGAKTNLVSTREDILWYVKQDKKYNYNKIESSILKKTGGTIGNRNGKRYRALSNVWTDISPIVPWSPERVKHPTQKPLALMERIVKIFSKKNQLILDCFAGSGTTGVACKKLNRNFICIEKNKEYFKIAKSRIKNV